MAVELTAVYREVPEGFIALVEELPGANFPRHREVNEVLAREICRDLEVREP